MNRNDWWQTLDPSALADLAQVWFPVGQPGFAGDNKHAWQVTLDARYGADGWRMGHYVRGEIVPPAVAIAEYEEAYRVYLKARPGLVRFLATTCGNVYDSAVSNVYDDVVRPAGHRVEPLPGHQRPARDRGARRRPRVAGRDPHGAR